MIYTATVLPFRLSFIYGGDDDWDTYIYIREKKRFESASNYFFVADILVNLFSAFYDQDNVLVTNNAYIMKNYVKGWLFIDVVSVYDICWMQI